MWAKASDPFPVVDTFAPALNATLRHATRFHLFMGYSGEAGNCLLEVEHVGSTRQETRVRIDGLSFSVADCRTVCYSLLRPITRSTVQHKFGHFGRRCAVGQGDGTFGHVGPACLRHARTSAEDPVYVQLPPNAGYPEGMCGLLKRHMYGTRRAAEGWQDEYSATLVSAGFLQGKASACVFMHPTRGIAVSVHGDDFTTAGAKPDLDWFEAQLGCGQDRGDSLRTRRNTDR